MDIDIICVGTIKDSFVKEGIREYLRRLGVFCKINIIESKEEKFKTGDSDSNRVLKVEGERILRLIDSQSYVFVLCIEGKQYSSCELSDRFKYINEVLKKKKITFIIGSSYGICDSIKTKADEMLSFSKLTFPHQLFRLNLLEQIYRIFTIINNKKYHK